VPSALQQPQFVVPCYYDAVADVYRPSSTANPLPTLSSTPANTPATAPYVRICAVSADTAPFPTFKPVVGRDAGESGPLTSYVTMSTTGTSAIGGVKNISFPACTRVIGPTSTFSTDPTTDKPLVLNPTGDGSDTSIKAVAYGAINRTPDTRTPPQFTTGAVALGAIKTAGGVTVNNGGYGLVTTLAGAGNTYQFLPDQLGGVTTTYGTNLVRGDFASDGVSQELCMKNLDAVAVQPVKVLAGDNTPLATTSLNDANAITKVAGYQPDGKVGFNVNQVGSFATTAALATTILGTAVGVTQDVRIVDGKGNSAGVTNGALSMYVTDTNTAQPVTVRNHTVGTSSLYSLAVDSSTTPDTSSAFVVIDHKDVKEQKDPPPVEETVARQRSWVERKAEEKRKKYEVLAAGASSQSDKLMFMRRAAMCAEILKQAAEGVSVTQLMESDGFKLVVSGDVDAAD